MQTLSYLTDVIGPRLTGSPNLKRANEWTRDKLTSWGLTNAHLEAWGPFGRGWSVKRFSAQIVEPQTIALTGFPKAWSPGFDKPFAAEVVHFTATNEAGLESYKGKLKGAIVLSGAPREVSAHFEPLATRANETNLLRLANAGPPSAAAFGRGGNSTNAAGQFGRGRFGGRGGGQGGTNAPPSTNFAGGGVASLALRDARSPSLRVNRQRWLLIQHPGRRWNLFCRGRDGSVHQRARHKCFCRNWGRWRCDQYRSRLGSQSARYTAADHFGGGTLQPAGADVAIWRKVKDGGGYASPIPWRRSHGL